MNKKFIDEVLRLAPEFSVVDVYFYEKPVGHILCGFVCEMPPSGACIWTYALPLYDRFEFLHLTFGGRLPPPDGFIDVKGLSDKEIAEKFVARIQPYRSEASSLANLDRFAAYIETECPLKSPTIRRGYALTLIMLDRVDEAMEQLTIVKSLSTVRENSEAERDLAALVTDLSAGIELAKKRLEGWELETKRALGLV